MKSIKFSIQVKKGINVLNAKPEFQHFAVLDLSKIYKDVTFKFT